MKHSFKKNNYIWSGISTNGKKMSGEITALSINLAKVNLKRQGITSIFICRKKKNLFSKTNKNINSLDIAIFFRQLATLVTAGSPIVQSFDVLQNSQEKTALKKLICNIKNEIESGKALADSLRKFPRYFDSLTQHLIYAGEQSGTLATMLNRIAQHKEKSMALKKQLIKALFYPAIIFIVTIIVTTIMLTCIVPRFAELFQSMRGQLPPFTLAVIFISDCLRNNFWLGIIPVLISGIFIYFLKKSEKLRHKADHCVLNIPIIGKILQKIILARLMRSLATIFSAGIPVTDALSIIAHSSGSPTYTKSIMLLKTHVTSGQQLYTAMQTDPLFPPMAIQMIKIGEESGALNKMLEKTAEFYELDIDNIIDNLSQLLEPLIMVILGVLIGGLVIAMYLPIFKLGTII